MSQCSSESWPSLPPKHRKQTQNNIYNISDVNLEYCAASSNFNVPEKCTLCVIVRHRRAEFTHQYESPCNFIKRNSDSPQASNYRGHSDCTTDTVKLYTASKIKGHPPTSIDRREQLFCFGVASV